MLFNNNKLKKVKPSLTNTFSMVLNSTYFILSRILWHDVEIKLTVERSEYFFHHWEAITIATHELRAALTANANAKQQLQKNSCTKWAGGHRKTAQKGTHTEELGKNLHNTCRSGKPESTRLAKLLC